MANQADEDQQEVAKKTQKENTQISLENLPDELLVQIFNHVAKNYAHVGSVLGVSKRFKRIMQDNAIWRPLNRIWDAAFPSVVRTSAPASPSTSSSTSVPKATAPLAIEESVQSVSELSNDEDYTVEQDLPPNEKGKQKVDEHTETNTVTLGSESAQSEVSDTQEFEKFCATIKHQLEGLTATEKQIVFAISCGDIEFLKKQGILPAHLGKLRGVNQLSYIDWACKFKQQTVLDFFAENILDINGVFITNLKKATDDSVRFLLENLAIRLNQQDFIKSYLDKNDSTTFFAGKFDENLAEQDKNQKIANFISRHLKVALKDNNTEMALLLISYIGQGVVLQERILLACAVAALRNDNLEVFTAIVGKMSAQEMNETFHSREKDGEQNDLLTLAVYLQRWEIVDYLLDKKEKTDVKKQLFYLDDGQPTTSYSTPLHKIAESGNVEVMKKALEKANFSSTHALNQFTMPFNQGSTQFNVNILYRAYFASQLEMVEYLEKEQKLVINFTTNDLLIFAIQAIRNNNLEMLKIILDKWAKISNSENIFVQEVLTREGEVEGKKDTLLSFAVRSKQWNIVDYLLNQNNIHLTRFISYSHQQTGQTGACYTALHEIAASGNVEIMKKALVTANMSCEELTNCYKSFLTSTQRTYQSNILETAVSAGHLEMTKYLVEEVGMDIHQIEPSTHSTMLHCAINSGNLLLVKYIVDKGVDVNAKEVNGYTAKYMAEAYRDSRHLSEYTKSDKNILAYNKAKYSPLVGFLAGFKKGSYIFNKFKNKQNLTLNQKIMGMLEFYCGEQKTKLSVPKRKIFMSGGHFFAHSKENIQKVAPVIQALKDLERQNTSSADAVVNPQNILNEINKISLTPREKSTFNVLIEQIKSELEKDIAKQQSAAGLKH